jgi:hypothetical protein
MVPKRIAVKFFADPDPGDGLDLAPAIGLFHRLIQSKGVEGLLVDVADYAHVPEGPGVVLIGHDVDYGIDRTAGRTGLLITRKHYAGLTLADVLRDTLRKGLLAMSAIEKDGALSLRFAPGAFTLRLLDRLASPNDAAAFEAARQAVAPLLAEAFGGAAHEVTRAGAEDPRKPLTLAVRASGGADAASILARLGAAPA